MIEDFSERLFAHYVGGQWRAPFATDALTVACHDGAIVGQIVPAGAVDVARAVALRKPADPQAVVRFVKTLADAQDDLAQLVALQSGEQPSRFTRAPSVEPCAQGAVVFGATDDLGAILDALAASVSGGVIWCPPPSHALLATGLTMIAQRADLPSGSFSLLHAQTPQTEILLRQTGLPVRQI